MKKIYYYSEKVSNIMKDNNLYINPRYIAELPIASHDGQLYPLVRFTAKLPSMFDECICSWYK